MPFIISLFGSIASFFAISVTKKTAYIAVMISASIALTTALYSVVTNLLTGIYYAMPDTVAAGAAFLPSNTAVCLTAVITAKTARFVYDWNMKNLSNASAIN